MSRVVAALGECLDTAPIVEHSRSALQSHLNRYAVRNQKAETMPVSKRTEQRRRRAAINAKAIVRLSFDSLTEARKAYRRGLALLSALPDAITKQQAVAYVTRTR